MHNKLRRCVFLNTRYILEDKYRTQKSLEIRKNTLFLYKIIFSIYKNNRLTYSASKVCLYFRIFLLQFYIDWDRIHILLEPFWVAMYREFIIWWMNLFWDKIMKVYISRILRKIICINLLNILKWTKWYHKHINNTDNLILVHEPNKDIWNKGYYRNFYL